MRRNGEVYAEEHGWNAEFEVLVARIVADFAASSDPEREALWIAEVDGEPGGCVFCVRKSDTVAQLRVLLVEPRARGLGLGARLVGECVRFARRAGYRSSSCGPTTRSCTRAGSTSGRGSRSRPRRPHHSFGHDLVGQHWSLTL